MFYELNEQVLVCFQDTRHPKWLEIERRSRAFFRAVSLPSSLFPIDCVFQM
jgi:hypothetical protein